MSSEESEEKPKIARTPLDLQRLKLEKLMKNPDKAVVIPEKPREKNTPHVPDFVRNVMGSSAGAGSGEFHVYRHLRRKEYARQKFIQEKAERELLEESYCKKIEENRQEAEERTAKKRKKRLKKKEKMKQKKLKSKSSNLDSSNDKQEQSSNDESDTSQNCTPDD
ncbi:PRKR-interacting protein 1 homolog [Bacillus rossius redtenbacheri]|uniref:PRKR-interacting protein 1 homolog n=1 Tax=Bacillus rossius redtenbacheri TaxID=93214 RepID=UPI002FDEB9BB